MRWLRDFDCLLAPSRCVLCRTRVATGCWCEACAHTTKTLSKACYRCGSSQRTGHACWPDGSPVGATVVAYDDSLGLRRALATATRHGVQRVFNDAAHALASRYFVREGHPTIVCAVPLARRATRTQPFDQRAVMTKMFSQAARLPQGPRLAHTRKHARTLRDDVALDHVNVVLVTDVIDTDPTLSAAVQLLDNHQVRRVDVVAVARYGDNTL